MVARIPRFTVTFEGSFDDLVSPVDRRTDFCDAFISYATLIADAVGCSTCNVSSDSVCFLFPGSIVGILEFSRGDTIRHQDAKLMAEWVNETGGFNVTVGNDTFSSVEASGAAPIPTSSNGDDEFWTDGVIIAFAGGGGVLLLLIIIVIVILTKGKKEKKKNRVSPMPMHQEPPRADTFAQRSSRVSQDKFNSGIVRASSNGSYA